MNISGSKILITGGTGSFGNRVAEHLFKQSPSIVRIFSRDEKKQWEMQQKFPQFEYIIGDVRDEARLEESMAGIDLVFHAAALKHVPSCEKYPFEAYKTNVVGSQNACRTAKAAGVKVFVALSTDKAVNRSTIGRFPFQPRCLPHKRATKVRLCFVGDDAVLALASSRERCHLISAALRAVC